ncbi:hypothetical protein [Hymenobacter metallilatus]|uniref:Copper resistance protein NlpE n=1 Tax=Hymenobacter metallilatus TaxID=2493666 RepID=A0A3R9PFE2_9BACT|nr:hypothetical protein [Hymenobacter metallilatus]RSK36322.1 hypothetical protein EI290_05420 [Hymenobacter metallilatus]
MRRASFLAATGLLTLPLMAALCCRPEVAPAPAFEEASLSYTWRQARATCFCPEACPTDSAGRYSQLVLRPDHTFQRLHNGRGAVLAQGTWRLNGFPYVLLTDAAGSREEFIIRNATGTGSSTVVGDSLYLDTHSSTDCRHLVFRKIL